MDINEKYMSEAIELAKLGWGKTNPNPLVGCLIVNKGKVIGKGYHRVFGGVHAEVDALNNSTEDVRGSTLYVNLEPCSHYGKTPPCVKAIIEAGVKEVVIAIEDPNPEVSGKGVQILKEAGIKVTLGVLKQEAEKLNEIFLHYISNRMPFMIMKTAMSLDGKIATRTGDSKWISGEESRLYVHKIRDRVSAVMVGVDTVISDNPSLTVRLKDKRGKSSFRIVVDSRGRIPLESKVLSFQNEAKTIIATTDLLPTEKEKKLREKGVHIIKVKNCAGRVDLKALMDRLYELDIDSVLLEGGGTLNAAALQAGIVNKIMTFIAPKIIGGENAKTPVEGIGQKLVKDAFQLKNMSVFKFGEDILIEAYL